MRRSAPYQARTRGNSPSVIKKFPQSKIKSQNSLKNHLTLFFLNFSHNYSTFLYQYPTSSFDQLFLHGEDWILPIRLDQRRWKSPPGARISRMGRATPTVHCRTPDPQLLQRHMLHDSEQASQWHSRGSSRQRCAKRERKRERVCVCEREREWVSELLLFVFYHSIVWIMFRRLARGMDPICR